METWLIALLVVLVLLIIIAVLAIAYYANKAVFPVSSAKKIYASEGTRQGKSGYLEGGVISTKVYDEFDTRGNGVIVLYCHGNTGNISQRRYVKNMCRLLGWNLVLFDYRGYGRSKKSPNTRNIMEDALVVYDEIRELHPEATVIIWGESLGGGPAVYTAKIRSRHHRKNRLVLMSTYATLRDVVDCNSKESPLQRSIKSLFLDMGVGNIDNLANIENTSTKTVIIHSTEDRFINFRNAEKLYQAAGNKATLFPIKGDHPAPVITTAQLREILEAIEVPHDPVSEQQLKILSEEFRHAATIYHLKE